jgi:DNA end-binding protein Ku
MRKSSKATSTPKGITSYIDPKEIDELKLEAKHTIDMVRFVDEGEIDSRYWEKPPSERVGACY